VHRGRWLLPRPSPGAALASAERAAAAGPSGRLRPAVIGRVAPSTPCPSTRCPAGGALIQLPCWGPTLLAFLHFGVPYRSQGQSGQRPGVPEARRRTCAVGPSARAGLLHLHPSDRYARTLPSRTPHPPDSGTMDPWPEASGLIARRYKAPEMLRCGTAVLSRPGTEWCHRSGTGVESRGWARRNRSGVESSPGPGTVEMTGKHKRMLTRCLRFFVSLGEDGGHSEGLLWNLRLPGIALPCSTHVFCFHLSPLSIFSFRSYVMLCCNVVCCGISLPLHCRHMLRPGKGCAATRSQAVRRRRLRLLATSQPSKPARRPAPDPPAGAIEQGPPSKLGTSSLPKPPKLKPPPLKQTSPPLKPTPPALRRPPTAPIRRRPRGRCF